MSALEIIGLITAIVTSLGVIIAYRSYKQKKRQGEEKVIREILDSFVIPTCVKLIDDIHSGEFNFPESLNLSYGVSTEDNSFKRFRKRKRLLAWKIKRYKGYCKKIDRLIGSLRAWSELHHIIMSFRDSDGVHYELLEQYWNHSIEQLNEVFMEYGYRLNDTLNKIKILQKRTQMKAERLQKQLNKLMYKWKEKYNIV